MFTCRIEAHNGSAGIANVICHSRSGLTIAIVAGLVHWVTSNRSFYADSLTQLTDLFDNTGTEYSIE